MYFHKVETSVKLKGKFKKLQYFFQNISWQAYFTYKGDLTRILLKCIALEKWLIIGPNNIWKPFLRNVISISTHKKFLLSMQELLYFIYLYYILYLYL